MGSELVNEFIEYGTELLSRHPDLPHKWDIDKDQASAKLKFPRQSSSGFDVTVLVDTDKITVHTGDMAHEHFKPEDGRNIFLVESVFGYIRDLLSPDMRLREKLAGDKPRLAVVESFDGEKWNPESLLKLIIWNFFAKRSEKIYINEQLPGRLSRRD